MQPDVRTKGFFAAFHRTANTELFLSNQKLVWARYVTHFADSSGITFLIFEFWTCSSPETFDENSSVKDQETTEMVRNKDFY